MKDGPAGFRQRSVTLRAVGLGAAGALAMAVIAPVNDHVLGNGFIVGSYLPVGLIVPLLLFVLLINGDRKSTRLNSSH